MLCTEPKEEREISGHGHGEQMRIEDSGGNHVTPNRPRWVLEGVQSDLEEAGGSGQTPLEPNARLCGSGTYPGWDLSDRKQSRRRAWEPGLICDSAGDSEDASNGTEEAPDEVEGIRMGTR
ncbi:hypothetical protein DFH07DRAFT_785432 [Mycena maculata]|uniref:Uncharacterized protein n=1 Tax=Mycena maculata TaxID=230809 RepID=A0AAD7MGF6_9AGAR|nr:hypothetical protein DFH07DRAFT_785432 [Mycena maculata]